MILVFDMDETLYEERTYVESGFRHVAAFINERFGFPEEVGYRLMMETLEQEGRGKIFDAVLQRFGRLTQTNIQKCVTVYRSHPPRIHLRPDAIRCLDRFHHLSLYVVTDGHKVAQDQKARALGLYQKVRKVFLTHRYGREHAKPSPYCFNKISSLEKTMNRNVVYIGDNPHKDFVGIKPLGFNTIRIRTGVYKDVEMPEAYEAHVDIASLDELTPQLLELL